MWLRKISIAQNVLGLQVRLPLRELLYKSCMERSQKCLHYAPRGRISQFNQSEIYGNIKSAWYIPPEPRSNPVARALSQVMPCLHLNICSMLCTLQMCGKINVACQCLCHPQKLVAQ